MTSQGSDVRGRASKALTALLGDQVGPVLVHSDVFRTSGAIPEATSRQAVLFGHASLLFDATAGRPIWMPAFNYDYLRTSSFAVGHDPSQVGALTEHFRKKHACWRTPVPVFSVCGTEATPAVNSGPRIDPFGDDSVFAELAEHSGSILLYGAGLQSCTFVHHVERAAGGPVYRYDKSFVGYSSGVEPVRTELLYHVRPRGHRLDYDWARLERELLDHGLLRRFDSAKFSVASIEAPALRAFWTDRLMADPLHLLDDDSRAWVEPKLHELGRGFLLSDFESVEHGEVE